MATRTTDVSSLYTKILANKENRMPHKPGHKKKKSQRGGMKRKSQRGGRKSKRG